MDSRRHDFNSLLWSETPRVTIEGEENAHVRTTGVGEHMTLVGEDLMLTACRSFAGNMTEVGRCPSVTRKTREVKVSPGVGGSKRQLHDPHSHNSG